MKFLKNIANSKNGRFVSYEFVFDLSQLSKECLKNKQNTKHLQVDFAFK